MGQKHSRGPHRAESVQDRGESHQQASVKRAKSIKRVPPNLVTSHDEAVSQTCEREGGEAGQCGRPHQSVLDQASDQEPPPPPPMPLFRETTMVDLLKLGGGNPLHAAEALLAQWG